MSYILDALKKADADRDRQVSAVPDLHAQADAAARLALTRPRAARWWGPALAATAVVLAAAAWLWLGPRDDGPAVPLAAASPPATLPVAPPTVVAPAPAPLPMPSPTMPPSATPPLAGMAQARPQALPQTLPPPAPVTRPPERRAEAAPRARAPLAAPLTQAPALAQAPGAPPAAAPPSRLPTFAELPPTLRSQLPPLAVGGSVYSRTAASRMVILNGQVFREGDRPMEGLSVDEIRLKSSVLSFRGTRFELPH